MMKWEAEQKGYTCNDCYLSMQNCHDKSICCEDETGLCDFFEELADKGESMTNEQAIEVLNGYIKDSSVAYSTFTGQALRMAIEALKAQFSKEGTTSDTISRQAAIDVIEAGRLTKLIDAETAINGLKGLPSAQPEQTKMIKEIRKWTNSANRGNADYFIVDKIEEIINKYE